MSIELRGVCKSFRQGERAVDVLKGVNLSVGRGESVAVLGRSGSGKSTLLSLMAGLDSPDRGKVRINEKDLQELPESDFPRFRAKEIGIIFQQFHLIGELTALENVALPMELSGENFAEDKARELLKRVGMADQAEQFAHTLSGGECQRVAIARALVNEPSVLLADEPTGNLDNDTADAIADLMFQIQREKKTTLILVTHSEELGARCGKILRLRHGVLE